QAWPDGAGATAAEGGHSWIYHQRTAHGIPDGFPPVHSFHPDRPGGGDGIDEHGDDDDAAGDSFVAAEDSVVCAGGRLEFDCSFGGIELRRMMQIPNAEFRIPNDGASRGPVRSSTIPN